MYSNATLKTCVSRSVLFSSSCIHLHLYFQQDNLRLVIGDSEWFGRAGLSRVVKG